jgi:hypothetical protein
VFIDKQLPTFARTIVLPSSESSSASGVEILDHEDGKKPSSETPVTIIQPKRRRIPEDLNLDKHIYEKLLKPVSSNKSVSSKIKSSARSEVLRVALLKMQLFWDSTLCRLVNSYIAMERSAFETSVAIYQLTQSNIPEDLNIAEILDCRNTYYYFLLLVFSPWASLGRNQSPVRQPVWLWYAASWASS